MDLQLDGKRALVTGGSKGIGKAVALALATEGCAVGLVARDADQAAATAAELAAATGRLVVALPGDTGVDADVDRIATRAPQELGGAIDIVVNAAATPNTGAPLRDEDLAREVNVKVAGYLRVARAFAPGMAQQRWGRIINIAGLAARNSGTVVGSVRNAAVAALTKNLADELGASGINVTVVHPGMTVTEKTPADRIGAPLPGVAIGRMVTAGEVADVVAFLASPRSVAITGDAIATGGGALGPIHY